MSHIASVLGASLDDDVDVEVNGISVDSRTASPGDLFCAVVGEAADGHDFIRYAAERGAVATLVSRHVESPVPKLVVDDISTALASIATYIRDRFEGVVVAVTGSVGKTTVKELISAALSSAGPVLKSFGNQNTEYGLPMTWMRLQEQHKFVVLEMGMRGRGQIAHLASFSKPTVGVITSLGTSHVGELGSTRAIAEAKSELLRAVPDGGLAVIPSRGEFSDLLRKAARCPVVTFGEGGDVSVFDSRSDFSENRTEVLLEARGERLSGSVPGLGSQQALNTAAAMAVCLGLDLRLSEAMDSMSRAEIPGPRMKAVEFNGATVLIDVYNSSPESCVEALRNLALAPGTGQRIAILGDMLELGDYAEEAHRRIGAEAARLKLDRLSLVGRAVHWIRDEAVEQGFDGRLDLYGSAEEAARVFARLEPGDVVLVKGSRGMALEKTLGAAGVKSGA
ncbi:MAG: UDP-N-acetylmuramoyl-tripeptide--D-alanyl-D-alanine ligase [Fimbriimonadales bacterium]